MSNIQIIFDTLTSEITFENNAGPYQCAFVAALERHERVIDLRGLSYGAIIKIDGEVKLERSWPPPNVKYVSTDQDVLERDSLTDFPPDAECHIEARVENAYGTFQGEHTFIIPRPRQPYSSWTWDATLLQWVAPVPYPDDGEYYVWNEETQSWDEDQL